MAEDKRKGERREQTDCATGGPVGWVEAAWTDVVTFVTMCSPALGLETVGFLV